MSQQVVERENQRTTQRTAYQETATCPLCGGEARFWLEAADNHYGNRGRWTLYECGACGHRHQHPIPDERTLGGYYPKTYYAYRPPTTDFTPQGMRHLGIRLQQHYLKRYRGYTHLACSGNPILAALGARLYTRPLDYDAPRFTPGGVLLDYGCGSGQTVALHQFMGWQAEGIEISADAVEAGCKAGLKLTAGSVEALEAFSARYDCILSSHCVEHVVEVERLFRAFYQALKPGGVLKIDIPNGRALETYREHSYYLGMPVHVHLFSPQSLQMLAEQVGFQQIEMATYSRRQAHIRAAALRQSPQAHEEAAAFPHPSRWQALMLKKATSAAYRQSLEGMRGDCLVLHGVKM